MHCPIKVKKVLTSMKNVLLYNHKLIKTSFWKRGSSHLWRETNVESKRIGGVSCVQSFVLKDRMQLFKMLPG